MKVGEEGDYVPVTTLTPPEQNDSGIKTGSNESHFNVLVGSDVQLSHKTVSTNHNF